ncbi:hypothetical protein [Cecembia calidifontis]|jgi:hypothetical protein|uniref:Uncharacterized protein n=1 Tax=Cecembia calidifontis TaxID=1187080 RepID=A0A4Q7PFK8_9BACT|nr:hypothetical protein [Cecembia calidifontis]RZS98608.1 hypothetical protein BC751_4273 [Cecembia calidifontis]
MANTFFVTFRWNRGDQSVLIISPEYRDIEDAGVFLDETVARLSKNHEFYQEDDAGWKYRSEAFTLELVKESAYNGIAQEKFDDGVFEACFRLLQEFVTCSNSKGRD